MLGLLVVLPGAIVVDESDTVEPEEVEVIRDGAEVLPV